MSIYFTDAPWLINTLSLVVPAADVDRVVHWGQWQGVVIFQFDNGGTVYGSVAEGEFILPAGVELSAKSEGASAQLSLLVTSIGR